MKKNILIYLVLTILIVSIIHFTNKADIEQPSNNEYAYKIQELSVKRDGKQIYGELYLPQNTKTKLPTVIISHGLGGNYRTGAEYAKALAKLGYAVYCFDFRGGSTSSRSDGSTLEMSIFTQQNDLEDVIDTMKEQSFVDEENIFLLGTSQGGVVSAMTAASRNDIQGLILLYPAFVLIDMAKEQFKSIEDIPYTYQLLWMRVGKIYAEKLLDYDVYNEISHYKNDVLIIHGTEDNIVPLSYSKKAVDTYPSADLKVLNGSGHGFYGSDLIKATEYITEYLNTHKK